MISFEYFMYDKILGLMIFHEYFLRIRCLIRLHLICIFLSFVMGIIYFCNFIYVQCLTYNISCYDNIISIFDIFLM